MGDVSIDLLRPLKEKVDYVALGHIHTNYEYDDFCYNPGSIENIRIKDATKSDKKGYYIVSFDDKKQKDVNFYISKQRKIYNISLKLEDDKSIIDIEKYIKEYDYNLEESLVLELSLLFNIEEESGPIIDDNVIDNTDDSLTFDETTESDTNPNNNQGGMGTGDVLMGSDELVFDPEEGSTKYQNVIDDYYKNIMAKFDEGLIDEKYRELVEKYYNELYGAAENNE